MVLQHAVYGYPNSIQDIEVIAQQDSGLLLINFALVARFCCFWTAWARGLFTR